MDKYLQILYNTYLYTSRVSRDKPFSPRKDFTKFDPQDEVLLKRINNLLTKYPHIKAIDYFKAPYQLYPDQDYFDLQYFSSMKGVAAYSLYQKSLRELPPDSDYQLEQIKNSLHFIAKYCIEHKIPVSQYTSAKTGITYDWMKHLKSYQISIYSLMEFSDVYDKIMHIPEDERELFLGELGKYYLGYKTKYVKSEIAKQLVTEGIKRISKIA